MLWFGFTILHLKDMSMKKVFYAVLNWGLGHAAHSKPIIEWLILEGYEVKIGSDGLAMEYLQEAFPSIPSVTLPSYGIEYAKKKSDFTSKIVAQLPKFFGAIRQEKKVLKHLLKEENFDLIISDNRYGIYDKNVTSIIICHQIKIKIKNSEWLVNPLHRKLLERFNEVWIPDYEHLESSLSGELSHDQFSQPTYYLGPLTSLKIEPVEKDIDLLVILSGPEPQRTILEEILMNYLTAITDLNIVMVRGTNLKRSFSNHLETYDLIDAQELSNLCSRAEVIISRSGLGSISDMHASGIKTILIPTPGQVEQEYLAKWNGNKPNFTVIEQQHLTQEAILDAMKDLTIGQKNNLNQWKEVIQDRLKSFFS